MADDRTSIITRRMRVTAALLFAGMLALSLWAYARLPADALVPIHWNAAGEADGYASRFAGLFLTVGIFSLVVGLLMLVPRIEPRARNMHRSAGAYRAVLYAVMVFFAALHAVIVVAALGAQVDVARVVMFGAGALYLVLGNWLPTVRRTYTFGIRTPWTLASETVWRRTHRVGGRAFVMLGVVVMGAALVLPVPALIPLMAGGALVLVVVLFGYSYGVWRTAPDRGVPDRSG